MEDAYNKGSKTPEISCILTQLPPQNLLLGYNDSIYGSPASWIHRAY